MSNSGGPILTVSNGGGQGPGGPNNHLVLTPGQRLYLGAEGGTLLLGPPGGSPGAMSLTDMQNRTWHLLREDGPDTGFPAPTTGDFNITVVTRDLNIALAQFVSQAGIPPSLTERQDNFNVLPVLDQPLPPGCASLQRIEYTPSGQQTYKLVGYSFGEFDAEFGSVLPSNTGQPYYFRAPFAGYTRLQPCPGPGNAVGPGTGIFTLTGTPTAGQVIYATLVNGTTVIVTGNYVVLSSDTLATVAVALSNLINNSLAVTGINAFLATTIASNNTVQLTALLAPGTQITYAATLTGSTMAVSPSAATNLLPNGDIITYYYSSLGTLLINPLDSPGLPPQFHMAPVYRVLVDYWRRKQDLNMAKEYNAAYKDEVARAKSYTFDLNRGTQPTTAGEDWAVGWPSSG
jgi:hypothetical protein